MSNETKKTETQPGLSSVQRGTEGSEKNAANRARTRIAEIEAREAALNASRGYGGYIYTDEIEELRAEKKGLAETLDVNDPEHVRVRVRIEKECRSATQFKN